VPAVKIDGAVTVKHDVRVPGSTSLSSKPLDGMMVSSVPRGWPYTMPPGSMFAPAVKTPAELALLRRSTRLNATAIRKTMAHEPPQLGNRSGVGDVKIAPGGGPPNGQAVPICLGVRRIIGRGRASKGDGRQLALCARLIPTPLTSQPRSTPGDPSLS